MKTPTHCQICESEKIIPRVWFVEQSPYSSGTYKAVVYRNPHAMIFKDPIKANTTAYVCGECGHIEFRVDKPQQFYSQVIQARGR
ncbi:hypothetical protein Pan258_16830 [Symmachiella dynata]|uniref:hypothetical protein n=1 Tax=Symmachiella dynata TaxID=2527995 RepID=UPI001188CCAE|nr:hypothetical protein [Symmachiella dynata]QDT47647.1 hypothetical protein Pan258_16830 [Symmachiella dynata]